VAPVEGQKGQQERRANDEEDDFHGVFSVATTWGGHFLQRSIAAPDVALM
jgi:hypothetical protein